MRRYQAKKTDLKSDAPGATVKSWKANFQKDQTDQVSGIVFVRSAGMNKRGKEEVGKKRRCAYLIIPCTHWT
jgi:hypothetical protein